MPIINETAYPTREVRRLVAFAVGARLAGARWLTVRIVPRRSNRESSEAAGVGVRGPVEVTLRLEPAGAFPRDYTAKDDYLPMSANTWQERLIFLAAHEAHHVELRRAGRWDEDTERAADRAGLRRLRGYRLRRLVGAV